MPRSKREMGRPLQEIQARVGKVYCSLAAKQAEVEPHPQELATDPQRDRRLCDWRWNKQALSDRPPVAT